MLSVSPSLVVCGSARSMLSSGTTYFDSHVPGESESTAMEVEQTVVQITQEVVRGMVGLQTNGVDRQFDRVYQTVMTIYAEHRTQMDQLVNVVNSSDLETTADAFRRVLDEMLDDGQMNCGRITVMLIFAGRLALHCIEREIISSSDVDRLAEVLGRHLATRLIRNQFCLVRTHFNH